jgi:hypothetical protein
MVTPNDTNGISLVVIGAVVRAWSRWGLPYLDQAHPRAIRGTGEGYVSDRRWIDVPRSIAALG